MCTSITKNYFILHDVPRWTGLLMHMQQSVYCERIIYSPIWKPNWLVINTFSLWQISSSNLYLTTFLRDLCFWCCLVGQYKYKFCCIYQLLMKFVSPYCNFLVNPILHTSTGLTISFSGGSTAEAHQSGNNLDIMFEYITFPLPK